MPKKVESGESALVSAAKTIGSAAGKIASMVGVEAPAASPAPAKVKVAKFQKKDKARLPRKEKKALKKAGTPKA